MITRSEIRRLFRYAFLVHPVGDDWLPVMLARLILIMCEMTIFLVVVLAVTLGRAS